MLKKKAPRKGLSDYQSEFCINIPTRIVLSGSVGSGDSNSRFLSYATIEKMKLRLPIGTFPGCFGDGKLPQPRKRTGGTGTPAYEVRAVAPAFSYGIPT